MPKNYDQRVAELTAEGYRVLALAYKPITPEQTDLTREAAESGLRFAGLLVCQTPLKPEAREAVRILANSGHALRVVSGDHVINTAVAARECGIIGERQRPVVVRDVDFGARGWTLEYHGLNDEGEVKKEEVG